MKKKKRILKIRWQLLLIFIPISIIPLVIVALFSGIRLFGYLEKKNYDYYSIVLSQVANNVDFVYEQYARTLSNIYDIPGVRFGLTAPPYNNKIEENRVRRAIIGEETIEGGLRNTVEEKIEGQVFLYEMDRSSLISPEMDTYIKHRVSTSPNEPYYDKMINDPLFLKIYSNNIEKIILGKFLPGVVSSSGGDDFTALIFPWYPLPPKNENDRFTKFLLVLFYQDFISDFYDDIPSLRYGTLYMFDQFNTILSTNHPGSDDYYEYDKEQFRYLLGEDDPDDPYEKMSFKEYSLLNTDPSIVTLPKIKSLLQNIDTKVQSQDISENNEPDSMKSISVRYNGKDYLTVAAYCPVSKIKLLFFLPKFQIYRPLYIILLSILVLTIGLILVLSIVIYFTSKIFTKPIETLSTGAEHISTGDYNIQIDTSHFSGEFVLLGNSFSNMATKINKYNEHLEELVNQRTMELNDANLQLQEMNRQKSNFLSYVTHELRTPLTSVIGFAKIIQSKIRDKILPKSDSMDTSLVSEIDKINNSIDIIILEGNRLTKLINNFLDLAKIESGHAEWNDNLTSIHDIIKQAQMATTSLVNQSVLRIINKFAANIPPIICDFDKLLQVMVNLISNAIKFTQSGTVTFTTNLLNDELVVKVQDTGSGISKESIDTIFEKYSQSGIASTNNKGTGLGLPICREIIKHYGGTIWVESTIGEGSTFCFTLPLCVCGFRDDNKINE